MTRIADRRLCQLDPALRLEDLNFPDIHKSFRISYPPGRRCQDAGADIVLICSNLMHRVADDVEGALDVPLLRITDAIADRARHHGWTQLGVLGTHWVMEEDFYVGRLARAGLQVHVPGPEDRDLVDRVIFDELTQGKVVDSSRTAYAELIRMLAADGAEAVVLGCTEIELLVSPAESPIPLLDSMRVHAEAAVAHALDDRAPAAAGS